MNAVQIKVTRAGQLIARLSVIGENAGFTFQAVELPASHVEGIRRVARYLANEPGAVSCTSTFGELARDDAPTEGAPVATWRAVQGSGSTLGATYRGFELRATSRGWAILDGEACSGRNRDVAAGLLAAQLAAEHKARVRDEIDRARRAQAVAS